MEEQIVVGLDIGTTKIACFIGMRGSTPDKIKILGYGRCPSNGVRFGIVENLDVTAKAIKKAIDEASDMANVEVKGVYIGVAGQHIRTDSMEAAINIPENQYQLIHQEDIVRLEEHLRKTAIIPEGHEIIHIFAQAYCVDGTMLSNDISPVGVSGNVLKGIFNVVTGNSNEIRKLIQSVQIAGYEVKDIILEPVASSYAVLNQADRTDGIALVDIGGGTTDIAVLKDDTIRFSSVIAMAGNVVTNDIVANFKIVPRLAEKIKTTLGSCLPSNVNEQSWVGIPTSHGQPRQEINLHTLAEIIKPRIETIFGLVALDLENSHNLDNLVNGIALTGGGANMKDIRDLAAFVTGVHCHIGKPDVHLEPMDDSEEQKNRMNEYNNPMYATGIGLVIHGLRFEEECALSQKAKEAEEAATPEKERTAPEIENPLPIEPTPTEEESKPKDPEPIRGWQKWIRSLIKDPFNDED